MRKPKLIPVILLITLALSGCSTARQVENQAYVLTMGLDKSEKGLKLTAQVPRIASSGEQESGSSGGSSNYFKFSAEGSSFEDVLEKLDWVIPRMLNLSHLKLIVLSKELAEDDNCRRLLYDIEHTERLFSAARITVCEGSAAEFIEKTKPVIGSRLSTDILSTFEHYINQGFVPDSNLAEIYYATESVYSDPMAAYAVMTKPESSVPASSLGGSIDSIVIGTDSEIATHYLGAAVFSEGVCRGILDADETIYANLLRGSLKMFRYAHDGQGLEIFPTKDPSFRINLDKNPISVRIKLCLGVSAQEELPDLEGLKHKLEQDILDTILHAQLLQVEPFGFAESAAMQFATLDDWIGFNWQERFANADIAIDIELRRTGA